MAKIDYQTLRGDISGGVTATFVALPVALALSGLVPRTLNALGILKHVPRHRIVDTMDEARQAVRGVIGI